MHNSHKRSQALIKRHTDSKDREPVHEVHRAIQRVNDPTKSRPRSVPLKLLLCFDRMIRKDRSNGLDDESFAGNIQVCDEVSRDALGVNRSVCELLEEFPMRAVIQGGREAWTLAPRIGRTGASMVLTPRAKDWADPELNRPSGWSIENARILWDSGVAARAQRVGRLS